LSFDSLISFTCSFFITFLPRMSIYSFEVTTWDWL
jgi:hypothetical protein